MDEIITKTESIYEGRIVNLSLNTVQLPDGSEGKREIITHPGAVAIVAIDEDDKVLMVRQFRSAIRRITLEIPAGVLHPGEDPLECAVRELREETGYRPAHIEAIGGVHPAPGYTTEYIHLFYATGLEHAPLALDADEFLTVERLPLNEAVLLVEDGTISDSKSIIGLLRVSRRSRG